MLLLIARISFLTKLIIYRLALLLSRSYLEISFGQIGITANLLSEEVVHQIQMDPFLERAVTRVTGRDLPGKGEQKHRIAPYETERLGRPDRERVSNSIDD